MPEDFAPSPSSQPSGGDSAITSQPGQLGAGGNEGTPSGSSVPASSPPPPQPTEGGGAGQPPAAPADSYRSIREAAYQMYGLDLRQMSSDEAALRHLVGQAAQAQQSQQYATRYLQHAGQFEQWLTSQQQAAAQQQKPSWWSPPEYNPAWRGLVQRDPDTGQMTLSPGAPPDILPKLLAYDQYRRDFADRLTSDPVNTLRPFVEDVAREIAGGLVQQSMGSYQEQLFADNYVAQNSGWLHQRDQQGNPVLDPFSRQPMLSPAGQRFRGYVEQLQGAGVTNIRIQEQQARAMVERDLAMAQLAQLQGNAQNGQIKNQFLQQNNTRQPNQSGSLAGAPGQPPAAGQGLSLQQRLTQRFREAGVTDADFAAMR
jgi:hypothetical protein